MKKTITQKTKMGETVSIVAHQLKNPLAVLRGYLEILITEDFGGLNKKQKEYIADALENIKRMSQTVNGLLDISRIEEGRYQMITKKISLEKIITDVIKDFSLWISAFNSEVSLKIKTDLPEIIADPLKIRQVIENLISNALKYKLSGRGKIEITLEKKGKNLLFSCKDNGIGISKEDSKNIFNKFYRSEKALEIDPSGSGLGLHIDKAIINLSGGKIWFKKNKNKGTIFYFTLPTAK